MDNALYIYASSISLQGDNAAVGMFGSMGGPLPQGTVVGFYQLSFP